MNALTITGSLYQVILNFFIDKKALHLWGILGFVVGIIGTILMAIGNQVVRKVIGEEAYKNSPIRRFL